jgi:CHAT domain-containing protein
MIAYVVGLDHDLYQEFGGGAWAFVISANRAFTVRVPGRLELEAMVPAFVGLVAAGGETLERAAAALHRKLLGEAMTRLGPEVERIVIVPDGVLHRLPFEALRTAVAAPSLGVRYELSTAPSATLWSRWRGGQGEEGPRIPRRALVLADPELPVAGSRSPAPRGGSLLERGLDLGPLPHARREGSRVCRALRVSCRLLTAAAASEAALEAAGAEPVGFLHLATHAVVDEAFPERSAVLLAPGADDQDGLLQPREAARLALAPSVVVLSGCRTAAGPLVGGEGVLSLARPFLEGGARAVLASRWPLRDDEAAAFFEWFYQRIARGDRLTAALRHARSRAEQAGLSSATTAGVFLLGDGSVRLEPSKSTLRAEPGLWVAILAVPVLALLLFARRRRAASRRAPRP